MGKIIINTPADIDRLQIKLRALKAVLPRIQESAAKNAAEDILDIIHSRMEQNNFSEKIIDATTVGNLEKIGGRLKQHFISDYESDTGFDVSKAREEGTASGITRRPKKPGGVLRWIGKNGKVFFRKKSTPKGIERLLIIEKTTQQQKIQFGEKFSDNIAISAKKVLGV